MKPKAKRPFTFEELANEARQHPEYWAEGARIEFTEDLTARMKQMRMTHQELSQLAKVSKGNVSKIFAHGANMTVETMAKLAFALDMTVSIRLCPKR